MLKVSSRIKSSIIFLASLLVFFDASSQAARDNLDGTFMIRANLNVDGSVLLFEDWKTAKLVDTNGNIVEDILVNYNTLDEVLISKLEDGNILLLNRYLYAKVILEDFELYNLAAFGVSGFGKSLFVGTHYSCFEKVEAIKSTSDSNKYNQVKDHYKIRKRSKTFLLVGDKVQDFRRSPKDLDKILPNQGIKSIVKENKLKLNKDEDLVRLLQVLDSQK